MTSDIHHDQIGRLLSQSESEKRRLEHEAARLFMRAYEKHFHQTIRHIWHNDPAKPDISCYLQGQQLDLEIAHLYASEQEARITSSGASITGTTHHQHYRGEEHLWAYLTDLASMDSKRKLRNSLMHLLTSKARKRYNSKHCWLVIRNVSPLWQYTDFVPLLRNLTIPDNAFDKIWLLPDFNGNEPLILLNDGGQIPSPVHPVLK